MTLCMVTDELSPHEIPLAAQLARLLGKESFRYIVSRATSRERIELGWNTNCGSWLLEIDQNDNLKQEAFEWIKKSDVVLFGNRKHELIKWRISRDKLSFYGSERWFKPPVGLLRMLHPRFIHLVFTYFRISMNSSFHYLALGKYAAKDMRRFGLFKNRIHMWGYFVSSSTPQVSCRRRSGPLRVLWVGRMLPLKRVNTLIEAVSRLNEQGLDIRLRLVGDGVEKGKLCNLAIERQRLINKTNIEGSNPNKTKNKIRFKKSVPIESVRELMREADVYVLPSNGYEGWGVVLNEAMLEGCAVIASRETGAGITLIEHKKNGLLFNSGNVNDLMECLRLLERDEDLRLEIAESGQRKINGEWVPEVAAQRLIDFSGALLAGSEPALWTTGPLSQG